MLWQLNNMYMRGLRRAARPELEDARGLLRRHRIRAPRSTVALDRVGFLRRFQGTALRVIGTLSSYPGAYRHVNVNHFYSGDHDHHARDHIDVYVIDRNR